MYMVIYKCGQGWVQFLHMSDLQQLIGDIGEIKTCPFLYKSINLPNTFNENTQSSFQSYAVLATEAFKRKQQIDQNSNYKCVFDFVLISPFVKRSNILNAEFIYRLPVLYVDPKQSK